LIYVLIYFVIYVQYIKVLWPTTVLKYASTKRTTRELLEKTCILENACCFYKTRRANNS
jgi:hypothetical protein